MSFTRSNLPLGRSRLVGQSLEYDWRLYSNSNSNRAYYCNYPDSNPDPNGQLPVGPMPENNPPPHQQPPSCGWPTYATGEFHYRAVNETNANFRRNEGYGERGSRPYYRGGSGNFRGQYSYPNAYSSPNPNVGPRSFDRQLRPPPPADDHRHWQYALKLPPSQNERFIILSYNILADYLVRDHWQQLYTHIPHFILDWDWRKKRLLLELGLWSPDIMCLQEVDNYQDILQELKERGYGGVCKERTGIAKDGCAIFWRTSRFELLHEENIEFSKLGLRDNVAQICVLQSKCVGNAQAGASHLESSGQKTGPVNRVVVCNIHVLFNPKRGEVKLGQVRVFLERAHAVSKVWDDAPVVIAGDFNCTPKSPLYDFLSKSELDISGLARNQISGQPESKPYFRHSPPNSNVLDLARMAGTILQSAMGNEKVPKDKTDTNSSTLRDSTSKENTPKDLTDASIKCPSVLAEKDLVSAGSKRENVPPGPQCTLESITSSTMDTKVNYGKDVEECYLMEQGQCVLLSGAKQTSQCPSSKETGAGNAPQTEEDIGYSSSEVIETQDKRYPNEFERIHVEWAGSSSEDCSMALTSVRNHSVSVEQEVSVMDACKDKKRSLDYSSERLLMAEEPTLSSNEIHQTNRHLCFQQNVKEDAKGEVEDNVLTITKARAYGSSTTNPLFLDETSPNEVKSGQSGHVSGSLENYQLADVSRKSHFLSGEKEVVLESSIEKNFDLNAHDSVQYKEGLAIDASDDCRRHSLSANSRITLAMEPLVTSLLNEVKETKEHSSLQEICKENVSVIVEDNGTNSSVATDAYGNNKHPQSQTELCPKEVGREHAGQVVSQDDFKNVATNAEKTSSLLSGFVSVENDTAGSGGMGIIEDIASEEQHFPIENAQNFEVQHMDEEQAVKQFDQSSTLPFESAELNIREVLSALSSRKNITDQEEEGKSMNVDGTMEKHLRVVKDGMNMDTSQPEPGLESTNQSSELYPASASVSSNPAEATITSYDPYSWSPMEVEAATGNADRSFLQHNLKLKSTYTEVEDYAGTKHANGEPQVTSYHRRFMGTVDYIWRTEGLQTVKVLDTLPMHILLRTRGFPTKKWGSDHLALACQLAFTSKTSTNEDH